MKLFMIQSGSSHYVGFKNSVLGFTLSSNKVSQPLFENGIKTSHDDNKN